LHVEVVFVGKFARFRRDAMPARITAQPEAIPSAFNVREMDLTPLVILGLVVPHVVIPTR